jgi:MFS family permease
MCFGTSAAATSLVFGNLVGRIGRAPFFLLAAIITFSILVFMEFFWHPEDHSHDETFFIVSAFNIGILIFYYNTN